MYDYIDDVEVYYTYNADGIRTQKEVNGVTTYYTLDGSKIISQKTGNVETFFEYDATGQVKCMTYNGATYYYVYNMLGDIIGLSNIAGNLVVSYKYHPYGEIKEYTDTSGINLANINPFRYKGYYFDTETGFYYCNSRYYDPELCRFLNADGVVSGTGESVHGYNLFAYCFNNPINMADDTGTWPKFIKNAVKWVAKNIVNPVVEKVETVLSKTDFTITDSISASGNAWLINGSGSIDLSIDSDGNVAFQATGSIGLCKSTGAGASAGRSMSVTNAPTVYDLEEEATVAGGSVAVPIYSVPVSMGAEYSEFGGKYNGMTVTAGIATSCGAEAHVGYSYTFPIHSINIFDAWDRAYKKIMEW